MWNLGLYPIGVLVLFGIFQNSISSSIPPHQQQISQRVRNFPKNFRLTPTTKIRNAPVFMKSENKSETSVENLKSSVNPIVNHTHDEVLDGEASFPYSDFEDLPLNFPNSPNPPQNGGYNNMGSGQAPPSYRPIPYPTPAPAVSYRPIPTAQPVSYRPTTASYRPIIQPAPYRPPSTPSPTFETICNCPDTTPIPPNPPPTSDSSIFVPDTEPPTLTPPPPLPEPSFPIFPIETTTNPPPPPRPTPPTDFTDLGTFPPGGEDEEDDGGGNEIFTSARPPSSNNQFPTIVPILGGRLRNSGRSLFGSNRRVVSTSAPIRTTPSVLETFTQQQRRLVDNKGGMNSFRDGRNMEEDPDVIKDFMFSDIKCYRTRQKEYFGAMVHMKSGFNMPYIRDRPQDPMSSSSSDCRMEKTDNPNSYHMKISDLRSCGVEQCGDENMCLTMVFPRVAMLALADDEVTTIKCTPQRRSMSETRTISFAGDSLEGRRSASTVEGGGQEFAAEVGVFRQAEDSPNGLFVRRINSGGVVQLGEPLQIRSIVRGGNGWTASKLMDVKVWRMRGSFPPDMEKLNPKDASEVITLVDPNGCLNEDFRVLSGTNPIRDPRNELVNHFNFKAFLFRGQRTSEPLVITAKVQACQDAIDCSSSGCSSEESVSRFRRSIEDDNDTASNTTATDSSTEVSNSTTISVTQAWNSQLALRVENTLTGGPTLDKKFESTAKISCNDKIAILSLAASLITILLCSLIFTAVTICFRRRYLNRNGMSGVEAPDSSSGQNNNNNFILKRSPSFHPEYFKESHKKFFGKINKPLPSPPPAKKPKTKIPDKSDIGPLEHGPAEYECIPEDEINNNLCGDGGHYIVYYQKRFRKGFPGNSRDSVKSDHSTTETRRRPLKKNLHRAKESKPHGSYPSRNIGKKNSAGMRSCREMRRGRRVNFSEDVSTQSQELSSEDSAYAGSVISAKKFKLGGRISSNRGFEGKVVNARKTAEFLDSIRNSNVDEDGWDKVNSNSNKTTHFITRNNLDATQIFIIPETNV